MLSSKHIIFLEVATQKSFTKASENLFISQPAISKSIKSLEENYKAKLFDRQGLKVILTPIGKLLYEKLLKVKDIQEQTEFEISYLKDKLQAKGVLKLGASTTVALYILPRVLSAFHKEFPSVEISLLNRNSEIVLGALLQQDINLGIIEGPINSKNVTSIPFLTDKVIGVCSANSDLTNKKSCVLKDLTTIPIVLREKGSGTLAALIQSLEEIKIKPEDLNVKVRLGGTEALKNFLLESNCLGFLPKRSVIKELKNGELKEIKIEGLNIERNFYFIQRQGENANELSKILIAFAKNEYNYEL
jgi:DNA-binding transcriptional LysR family regulator